MFAEWNFWIQAGLVLAAALFALGLLRTKWPIRIVANAGGVRTQMGISRGQQGRVNEFFRDDVRLGREVTILARRDQNGKLHLRFRGRLDWGTRQQIRNFLLTID